MTFAFVVRPTRSTFPGDATPEESAIIGEHFQHLKAAFEDRRVHFVGRCEDAAFGITIFDADSYGAAEEFVVSDPAVRAGLFSSELREFRVVFDR